MHCLHPAQSVRHAECGSWPWAERDSPVAGPAIRFVADTEGDEDHHAASLVRLVHHAVGHTTKGEATGAKTGQLALPFVSRGLRVSDDGRDVVRDKRR